MKDMLPGRSVHSAMPASMVHDFGGSSGPSGQSSLGMPENSAATEPPVNIDRGFSFQSRATAPQELVPKPSHPTNPLRPLAPLLTPFKMMKPLVPSKATAQRIMAKPASVTRTFMHRYMKRSPVAIAGGGVEVTPEEEVLPATSQTSQGVVSRFDGTPPMGYLWLWMGGFMRWRRRFFVASEAPGVVLIYKRMNMKGKVFSISLSKASIHADDQDARQLKIVTPAGLIFLRAVDPVERDKWLRCLSQSIAMYREKQQLVVGLQEQGLLPTSARESLSKAASRTSLFDEQTNNDQEGISGSLKLNMQPEVADMDVEQRKRIRTRVGENLAAITPYQVDVEHHLNQLSTQLLGVVSALNIRVGTLSPGSGGLRLSHFLANANAAKPPMQQQQAALPGAAAAAAAASSAMAPGASLRGQSPGAENSDTASEPASSPAPQMFRKDFAASRRMPSSQPTNLQQAYGQMLEAFRSILHGEAVKVAQLEAENQALHKTLHLMKATMSRHQRSRGTAGGLSSVSLRGASFETDLQAPLQEVGEEGEDMESDFASVMTADEDAFDLEPLEDYDGSEEMLDATAHGDIVPMEEPGQECEDMEDDECEEEDEEEDEEVRQEVEVMQALEVVRQVQYVEEANRRSESTMAAIMVSEAPPQGAPEECDDEDDDEEEVTTAGQALLVQQAGEEPGSPDRVSLVHVPKRRTRMPGAKPLGRGFSVWSILKNMIGKDLTRITMPATINEPLDFLQRLAESFEYPHLLDQASATQDSPTRMMLVAVWQLSCYNSQPLREGKPFNPLLGETYEWMSLEGGVKYLCEQVSHHPPVSAFHAQGGHLVGRPWEVQGEFEVKTKFWGKSIELIMDGCEGLRLSAFDEEYRWNKATICVQDLIFGNYWAELYGKVNIINRKTGDRALLNLKPCKGKLQERGKFEGVIFDGNGKEVYRLFGSTMDKVYAALTPEAAKARGATTEAKLMWEKEPYPEDHEIQYNFTKFAIALNDPADPYVAYLPPSDARFRPDQRALEVGDFARATTEKLRLEEKQRQARHQLKDEGKTYRPLWFKQVGEGEAPAAAKRGKSSKVVLTKSMEEDGFVWAFTGEYWERRAKKDWAGCPDLY